VFGKEIDEIPIELFEEVVDVQDIVFVDVPGFPGFDVDVALFARLFKYGDVYNHLVVAVVAMDVEQTFAADRRKHLDVFVHEFLVAGGAGDGLFQIPDDLFEFRKIHG